MQFSDLIEKNKKQKRSVVAIPRAADDDVLLCVSEAIKNEIADFILIDNSDKIRHVAKECGAKIEKAQIIDNNGEEADACLEACRLVFDHKAQVLMKGLLQTSTFMKSLLNKEFGFVPSGSLLSHIGLFSIPNYPKTMIVTDAAINIAPNLEEKARIMENAIKTARALGIKTPKIAVISAVEKVNPKIQSTVDADALKQMAQAGKFGDVIVDGPFGLDAAVSEHAAKTKGIKSEVSGSPDILLLPALDAGNVLYKSLTCFAGANPASVVAGASIPVVLTSRSDHNKTKLYSLALASYLAQQKN